MKNKFQSVPSKTHRYFIFDREDSQYYFFENSADRDSYVPEVVSCYLDDDRMWPIDEILNIYIGELTHWMTETNIREVDQPNGELDEDGFDEDGEYFNEDILNRYYCDWSPVPI